MKKLVIGVFVVLIATFSCKKNESHNESLPEAATTLITLNGIDKETAFEMMQNFKNFRGKDINPVKTNVWFSKTTVDQIVNLLESEGADGIRIYFVSDLNGNGSRLKNSIALVSTKSDGTNSAVPSGMNHVDYYEHSATNTLFSNLKAIRGNVAYKDTENNAILYKTCGTCKVDVLSQPDNIHHISRKVAERMVQHFGDHPINTISEWFDLGLFKGFTTDKNYDGMRIYFATKSTEMQYAGSDAFVIIKTIQGSNPNTHIDYFGDMPNNQNINKIADGGQDNGELCPTYCNLH